MRAPLSFVALVALVACSRPSATLADAGARPSATLADAGARPSAEPSAGAHAQGRTFSSPAPLGTAEPAPEGARPCPVRAAGLRCLRFDTAEAAFRSVLASNPAILAVGEAHAQKGTEDVPSATRRFTEQLLPLVAPRASDIVVELWAPDPRCHANVEQVASAQKPVTATQASTNPSEYSTLGKRAKELGLTPWLLRPSCDDFAALADAGADAVDAVDAMLRLVKRLTQTKLTLFWERNRIDAGDRPMVLAYGGALHNDLRPAADSAAYSFGPELDRLTGGSYVELDLIVPEYVKKTPTWEKLPWFTSWEADADVGRAATLYSMGDGNDAPRRASFVLVLPRSQ